MYFTGFLSYYLNLHKYFFFWCCREIKVRLALMDPKEQEVLMVKLDLLDHKDPQEALDIQDAKVLKVLLDFLVKMARR